jgi:hypothetical protein
MWGPNTSNVMGFRAIKELAVSDFMPALAPSRLQKLSFIPKLLRGYHSEKQPGITTVRLALPKQVKPHNRRCTVWTLMR